MCTFKVKTERSRHTNVVQVKKAMRNSKVKKLDKEKQKLGAKPYQNPEEVK